LSYTRHSSASGAVLQNSSCTGQAATRIGRVVGRGAVVVGGREGTVECVESLGEGCSGGAAEGVTERGLLVMQVGPVW
jgi:hypothetical protein